jgi:hypothetical protein
MLAVFLQQHHHMFWADKEVMQHLIKIFCQQKFLNFEFNYDMGAQNGFTNLIYFLRRT